MQLLRLGAYFSNNIFWTKESCELPIDYGSEVQATFTCVQLMHDCAHVYRNDPEVARSGQGMMRTRHNELIYTQLLHVMTWNATPMQLGGLLV